jgi:hypothetical protein
MYLQRDLAIAMKILADTPKSCFSNMLASQNGWAIDFKCTSDEAFIVMPRDKILTQANHFESEAALSNAARWCYRKRGRYIPSFMAGSPSAG